MIPYYEDKSNFELEQMVVGWLVPVIILTPFTSILALSALVRAESVLLAVTFFSITVVVLLGWIVSQIIYKIEYNEDEKGPMHNWEPDPILVKE